jgi:hypothetical protein
MKMVNWLPKGYLKLWPLPIRTKCYLFKAKEELIGRFKYFTIAKKYYLQKILIYNSFKRWILGESFLHVVMHVEKTLKIS